MADGTHDSFVAAALMRIPEEVRDRWLAAVAEHNSRLDVMLGAARRGVWVAPPYRLPLAAQYGMECERRALIGDPTAEVWGALAESVELAEAVRRWEPEFVGDVP